MISVRKLIEITVLSLGLVASISAVHAQTCSAAITNLNFGNVTPGAMATLATTGTLTINCIGNGNRASVQACVDLGPGSGGATGAYPNISTRLMTNPATPSAQLPYRLRRVSGGGVEWNREQFTILQNSFASGTSTFRLETAIHASIVLPISTTAAGNYSSVFSGLVNASIVAGNDSCSGTAQAIAPFTVSANLTPSCTVSTSDLAFGLVPPSISAPIDASSAINVTCSAGTNYSVGISLGNGPGATNPANRLMTSGASMLAYGLYQDSGRSLVWGDQPTNKRSGLVATGSQQVIPVYGRILQGQSPLPGEYSDIVVITVEY